LRQGARRKPGNPVAAGRACDAGRDAAAVDPQDRVGDGPAHPGPGRAHALRQGVDVQLLGKPVVLRSRRPRHAGPWRHGLFAPQAVRAHLSPPPPLPHHRRQRGNPDAEGGGILVWIYGGREALKGVSLFKQQIHVRGLAAGDARGLGFVVPRNNEGAGNAGCALHPRSRVQRVERKSHTSIQGSGGDPTFPAQWLYGLYRALPGVSGFLASVASRKLALWPGWAFAPPKDLTPTTEESEPHDFAVRPQHRSSARPLIAHGVYPALRSHRAHDAAASTG